MDERPTTGTPGSPPSADPNAAAATGAGGSATSAPFSGSSSAGSSSYASPGSAGTATSQESVYAGTPPNGNSDGYAHAGPPPTEAVGEILSRLGELKEYASYFVAAKLDGVKITVRNIGVYAVLGIVGLIVASAVVTTAVVLLLVGLALAIGKPFDPDQPWVGAVIVGLLVLGGLVAGVIFGMKKLTNTSRRALVTKYESRQREQRIRFGHDVRGREADPAEVP